MTPHKTCVYFANWSVYQRKHFAVDIAVKHVTHLFYAFVTIDVATGSVKLSDEWCDKQLPLESPSQPGSQVTGSLQQIFQLKQLNRNLKLVMSIGGWGTEHLFQAVVADPNKLDRFVDTAVQFVVEYGFDGIDIDWEYPKSRQESLMLQQLLHRVRLRLDTVASDLILTIAAPAGNENIDVLDLAGIDRYLSFWNVMCYDYAGSGWSSKTGFHSNLFGNNGDNDLCTSGVINRYIQGGVPASKLVMGMPMYGRSFNGVIKGEIGQAFSKDGGGNDTLDYKTLPVGKEYFDYKKVAAYCYDESAKKWVSYDNHQSARIKAKYAELNGLGGGMWWDSCGENVDPDRSLIINYVDQVGGFDKLEQASNHLDIYASSSYLKELLK
ncbi:glycoside hydrolase family 18 protein [Suhomyces tanzawaensis NRRL Y-17324]|uniref:chitinase n=1 Tax=Suhomyces tanzawaensis NRRL Y-17324 TaxID=984487 RepID=A0A1E4SF39_9ASCO|nr:glycoside hydrolase family 18 protein [Suhomyces tanzawaensis NRRL Y-17324]ODV78103.1 glycoside hydrolase family 18 protein [Suhomyces tanzawaensis NRRL Y-17324]